MLCAGEKVDRNTSYSMNSSEGFPVLRNEDFYVFN